MADTGSTVVLNLINIVLEFFKRVRGRNGSFLLYYITRGDLQFNKQQANKTRKKNKENKQQRTKEGKQLQMLTLRR